MNSFDAGVREGMVKVSGLRRVQRIARRGLEHHKSLGYVPEGLKAAGERAYSKLQRRAQKIGPENWLKAHGLDPTRLPKKAVSPAEAIAFYARPNPWSRFVGKGAWK
jgi:hypothetical protein